MLYSDRCACLFAAAGLRARRAHTRISPLPWKTGQTYLQRSCQAIVLEFEHFLAVGTIGTGWRSFLDRIRRLRPRL
jgi:hypothetical protein